MDLWHNKVTIFKKMKLLYKFNFFFRKDCWHSLFRSFFVMCHNEEIVCSLFVLCGITKKEQAIKLTQNALRSNFRSYFEHKQCMLFLSSCNFPEGGRGDDLSYQIEVTYNWILTLFNPLCEQHKLVQLGQNFDFRIKDHWKKFLWATRLWVGRW